MSQSTNQPTVPLLKVVKQLTAEPSVRVASPMCTDQTLIIDPACSLSELGGGHLERYTHVQVKYHKITQQSNTRKGFLQHDVRDGAMKRSRN